MFPDSRMLARVSALMSSSVVGGVRLLETTSAAKLFSFNCAGLGLISYYCPKCTILYICVCVCVSCSALAGLRPCFVKD